MYYFIYLRQARLFRALYKANLLGTAHLLSLANQSFSMASYTPNYDLRQMSRS